jgi:hypothetical protein
LACTDPAHASLHDVMRKIWNGVWSLNVEPLNFEPPQGFERSKAIERLERLERTSI